DIMLQFKNKTPFKGTILVVPNPDGIDTLYTILKGTFTLGKEIRLAPEQLPLQAKDEFTGDPGQSSLRAASDLSLMKPSTDVLLSGTAHASGGTATTHMEVTLVAGPIRKTVAVIGDRVWQPGLLSD